MSLHGGELPWHVDVSFLRLRFRSLWRGFFASHSSSQSTKGFYTNFLAMFWAKLGTDLAGLGCVLGF